MNILLVGLGGFLGSIARYLVYVGLRPSVTPAFPVATLAVNTLGCLIIGFILTLSQRTPLVQQPLILLLSVGFLGAFTTFSAFGFETIDLLRLHLFGWAGLNVGANLILGFAAVLLGRYLAGLVAQASLLAR